MSLASYIMTTAATVVVYDVTARLLPDWCDTHPGRMYRAVNGVKGVTLALGSIPGLGLVIDVIFGTSMCWHIVPHGSTVYAALDMAAILVLDHMHRTTTIHHFIVQVLHAYMASTGFAQEGLCLPIVVFACFSCIAFLANIRLALRGLPQNTVNRRALNYFVTEKGYFVYLATCSINLVVQIYLVFKLWPNTPFVAMSIYLGAAYMVFTDDLALINWMHNRYEALLQTVAPPAIISEESSEDAVHGSSENVFESEDESEQEDSSGGEESEKSDNGASKVEAEAEANSAPIDEAAFEEDGQGHTVQVAQNADETAESDPVTRVLRARTSGGAVRARRSQSSS
jgi:hypothetical protein